MEDAAAKKRNWKWFFFIVRHKHDWAPIGMVADSIGKVTGLVDPKLKAIKFPEQVIRKIKIRLINLIDEHHRAPTILRPHDSSPEGTEADVIAHVLALGTTIGGFWSSSAKLS